VTADAPGGPTAAAESAPPRAERPAWLFVGLTGLTLVTGVVDACSFLGLAHTFTANMTGNVLLLGFALAGTQAAGQEHLSVLPGALALAGFVAGACAGALVVRPRGRPRRHLVGFGAECVLLTGAVVVVALGGVTAHRVVRDAMVVLLALAMGMQNAVVRRMGLPDVNTTVLTTTLGGLAADVVTVKGRPARWPRRVGTVVFLFLGAVVGALLVHRGMLWGVGGALAVALAAVLSLTRSGRLARPDPG
jgi:uncharacterized membrane protein YoaK (UPF0700 family)